MRVLLLPGVETKLRASEVASEAIKKMGLDDLCELL